MAEAIRQKISMYSRKVKLYSVTTDSLAVLAEHPCELVHGMSKFVAQPGYIHSLVLVSLNNWLELLWFRRFV